MWKLFFTKNDNLGFCCNSYFFKKTCENHLEKAIFKKNITISSKSTHSVRNNMESPLT